MALASQTQPCEICRGTGIESTYWGEIHCPPYGSLKVDGEHDLDDLPPGAVFYGGSSHKQCRCRKRQ